MQINLGIEAKFVNIQLHLLGSIRNKHKSSGHDVKAEDDIT